MALALPPALAVDTPAAPLVGRIPVRSLWVLMLYASDLYRSHGTQWGGTDDDIDDLPDVLGEMLARIVERRRAQGLTQGYRAVDVIQSRVRGRIDLLRTERRRLLERGLVACRFDELSFDTPRNRLVLFAFSTLAPRLRGPSLAARCRRLAAALQRDGVKLMEPTRARSNTERYGSHDAEDRFMVEAARLVLELVLPSEDAGRRDLDAPDREEVWVRKLFERAIGGFYRATLDPAQWSVVCGGQLKWPIVAASAGIGSIFPAMMVTDIVLDHRPSGRRLVIDTKFNAILAGGWHREESLRLRVPDVRLPALAGRPRRCCR